MNGTIEKMVTLVSFGNHYLKSGELPHNFYPDASAFRHYNNIDFRDVKKKLFSKKLHEKVIAADPVSWFQFLKDQNCKRLFLYYKPGTDQLTKPDHKLAAFVGGGGTWMIETVFDFYSSFWAERMEVTNKDAIDNRIWSANFGRTLLKCRPVMMQPGLIECSRSLRSCLQNVINFCDEKNLNPWKNIFREALMTLSDEEPEKHFYNQQLINPDEYPIQARQLLFGAAMSFVFGGMGSWNDCQFDDADTNSKYDHLSAELYSAICQSIVSATNYSLS